MAHVACYVLLLSQNKIKEYQKKTHVKEENKVNGTINKKAKSEHPAESGVLPLILSVKAPESN